MSSTDEQCTPGSSSQHQPHGTFCSQKIASSEKISESNESVFTFASDFLCGKRIFDVPCLFKQILNSERHRPFDCNITDMEVISETRKGLKSTFTLKCKMCNIIKFIHTEDGDSEKMDVNLAITLGAISTGIGHSQLEELASTIDMPMMTYKTYSTCHEKVSDKIFSTTWIKMKKAAEQEAQIAKDLNEVDGNGIPCITVIADGAWSKRSYNVNYNAASGVACIIGYRTGKLLHLGVRNKYCSICDSCSSKNVPVINHKCFKNWSGPSTAMETDIIVEGFKTSIQTHGLKYTTLVGDGDSSITKKLTETKPYGNSTVIQKVECRNHLLRNFSRKIRELCKRSRSTSKNKHVPPILKKEVEKNAHRLRIAITKATKHWINENIDHDKKVEFLRRDILNAPSHVFGEHLGCAEIGYFKCERNTNDPNFVPAMTDCGIYRDIEICLNRLILNIHSLLLNMTNNLAEQYNSVVCKFVGGKRVNFSLRGSYKTRCEAASLSFNTGPDYYSILHEAFTERAPTGFTLKYVEKMRRKRIATAKAASKRKLRRQEMRKKNVVAPPDSHYGLNDQLDLDEEEYVKAESSFLKQLKKTPEEIVELESRTRQQSSSTLWMKERQTRLTASNFGKICKMRSKTSSVNTIKNLLYPTFKSSAATDYGKIHETFAVKEFEDMYGLKVTKCGLFVDPVHFYLGASPDGIIDDESIMEVKCPASIQSMSPEEGIIAGKINFATIENGELKLKRNHNYYYQVQGQMVITRRTFCYFVIWSQKGMLVEKISRDDHFWETKMIIHLKIFYFNCLMPELVDPRLPRGLPIRDPDRNELRKSIAELLQQEK